MLLQFIINILHLSGNALRILYLVMTVLFLVTVIFPKAFPGKISFRWSVLSGAVYPVFLFLTNAVHPYLDQKEGALRLALLMEAVFLLLAFRYSRFILRRTFKTLPAVMCVYVLSWFFFVKFPVSFTAMEDLLYLVVPIAAAMILAIASPELPEGYIPKNCNYNDVTYRIISDNWNERVVENASGEQFVYDKNARVWKATNGSRVDSGFLNLDDPDKFY